MKPLELKTWQSILLGFLLGAVSLAAVIYISLPDRMVPFTLISTATSAPVFVHVSGAVQVPGLYPVPSDSRIQDAINQAGGLTETADTNQINLASRVVDGQKIFVPKKDESIPQQNSELNINDSKLMVHLNSASLKELELLPGIGEEKASAILSEREKLTRFQSIEDLLQVPGISEKILKQIQPFIQLD
jgi:competence protein ComEA